MTGLGDKEGGVRKRARARATRSAGQLMRSRLLDVASGLFKAHGLAGVAITAIAEAADAFPSQITYYFRTKEALFVEAACRDMLHIAARAETAAARARTPGTYMRALVDTVMEADGLALFVEALVLSRQRHRSRAAGCAHDRAVAPRWRARLCGRGVTPRVARLQRAGHDRAQVLGDALGVALEGQGMGRSAPKCPPRCAKRSARWPRCSDAAGSP